MKDRGIAWERLAAMLFCLLILGGLLLLGVRYLFPVLLPFLIAWLLSLAIRPLSVRVSARTGIPQRLCATSLLVLLLAALLLLAGLLVGRLMRELTQLLSQMLESGGALPWVGEQRTDPLGHLLERLGIHPAGIAQYAAFQKTFYEMMDSLGERLLERLSTALPAVARWLLSSFPSVLLTVLITVIAGFSFCMNGEAIAESLLRLLPMDLRERIPALWRRAGQIFKRYLRIYLVLLGLTFLELLLGFLILRVRYALLLAALIALVDLLPILGVGTVLLPWAVVAFFQKNFYLGFGLCALYLVIVILRQILEPRLMGRSLGLHPLLALFAGYAGWRWLGFWGMALGPLAALLLKSTLLPLWLSVTRGGENQ